MANFNDSKNKSNNRRPNHSQKKQIEEKNLPYDFIPFPKNQNWNYIYEENPKENLNINLKEVPKHNIIQNLTGKINYSLVAKTDLALDFREVKSSEGSKVKKYEVSGSAMRGKVRNNLEILSASYPLFVERMNMTYRDLAGSQKRKYNKKLIPEKLCRGIEEAIHTGFLKKENDSYYIEPAINFGKKHFRSIAEDELVSKFNINKKHMIYEWSDQFGNKIKEFYDIKKLRAEINKFTKRINETKSQYSLKSDKKSEQDKELFKLISKRRDEIFKTNFNLGIRFKNRKNSQSGNEKLIEKMCTDLQTALGKIDTRNLDLEDFHLNYVKRLSLKAEIFLKYKDLDSNSEFEPYAESVLYKMNGSGGEISLKSVGDNKSDEGYSKGYIYNSTNTSSKKSHYLIGERRNVDHAANNEKKVLSDELEVSESLIVGYREQMKNFKVSPKRGINSKNPRAVKDYQNRMKTFYDIFDSYDKIRKNSNDEIIVFYRLKDNKVIDVSRTPYMRLSYENQISDLITKERSVEDKIKIDYSRAMFGYVFEDFRNEMDEETFKIHNKNGSFQNYKGRLRFTPLEIKTNSKIEIVKNFTLMSPSPTANAMYVEQKLGSNPIRTYEDDGAILNGYKYYKLRNEAIVPDQNKNHENYQCDKYVLKCNDIKKINGSIYFENLNEAELGLLILSLEINQIKNIDKVEIENNDSYYESIGGAKPYGYGRVQPKIEDIEIYYDTKNNATNIGFWLEEKESKKENKSEIEIKNKNERINQYIREYLKQIPITDELFGSYLKSKTIQDNVEINWENVASKIQEFTQKRNAAGYPSEWKLKRAKGVEVNLNKTASDESLKALFGKYTKRK